MFREVGYGVMLFLAAAIGALLGPGCIYGPIRGGPAEIQIQEDVIATILGASVGAGLWLTYKYKVLLQGKP
jgi:hypothetical protein